MDENVLQIIVRAAVEQAVSALSQVQGAVVSLAQTTTSGYGDIEAALKGTNRAQDNTIAAVESFSSSTEHARALMARYALEQDRAQFATMALGQALRGAGSAMHALGNAAGVILPEATARATEGVLDTLAALTLLGGSAVGAATKWGPKLAEWAVKFGKSFAGVAAGLTGAALAYAEFVDWTLTPLPDPGAAADALAESAREADTAFRGWNATSVETLALLRDIPETARPAVEEIKRIASAMGQSIDEMLSAKGLVASPRDQQLAVIKKFEALADNIHFSLNEAGEVIDQFGDRTYKTLDETLAALPDDIENSLLDSAQVVIESLGITERAVLESGQTFEQYLDTFGDTVFRMSETVRATVEAVRKSLTDAFAGLGPKTAGALFAPPPLPPGPTGATLIPDPTGSGSSTPLFDKVAADSVLNTVGPAGGSVPVGSSPIPGGTMESFGNLVINARGAIYVVLPNGSVADLQTQQDLLAVGG